MKREPRPLTLFLRVIAVFDGREYIESRLRIVPPVTLHVALIVHHVQYVAFLCTSTREGVITHPTCVIYTLYVYIHLYIHISLAY